MKKIMLSTVAALALTSAAYADSHSLSTGLTSTTDIAVGASTDNTSVNADASLDAAVDATVDGASDAAGAVAADVDAAVDASAETMSDAATEAEAMAEAGVDAVATAALSTSAEIETMLSGKMDGWTSESSTAVSLEALIGADVYSTADEDIGDVSDMIMIDGKQMLILEVGGFLGIGEKQVAIDANSALIVKSDMDEYRVYVNADADYLIELAAYEG